MVLRRSLPLLLLLLVAAAACATPPPPPGAPIRLEVARTMTEAELREGYNRNVRNAVDQGVTREGFRAGRLVSVQCARRGPDGGAVREESWWVRVPEGIRFLGRLDHREYAEFVPGVPSGQAGPLGRVLAASPAPPRPETVEVPLGVPGMVHRAPDCDRATRPGAQLGEVILVSGARLYDALMFERAWIRALPQPALREGRVVAGRCALAENEAAVFYAELPPDLPVRSGEVVEALAGVPLGADPGPIARVTGRMPAPPIVAETLPIRGGRLVRCAAPSGMSGRG